MDSLTLTVPAVTEAGMSRLRTLVSKFGINSAEVLEGCVRWGMILDDVQEI